MLTNQGAYISGLITDKLIDQIPRLSIVQNELAKRVLPPIPFLPVNNNIEIRQAEVIIDDAGLWQMTAVNVERQFFPLSFRSNDPNAGDQWYTFPFEPLINISGKNNIVKRSVSKSKMIGTVKERWSQDDYSITITGSIFGMKEIGTVEDCFPIDDFQRLANYCTTPYGISVKCEPLQLLGIDTIVVESFNFPFTKGENVQAYEINCLSDYSENYLLEIE